MKHISKDWLKVIQSFEGFSPLITLCPGGYPTIGYGHRVLDGEKALFVNGITTTEALELLHKDIALAEQAVLRLIHVPLSQGQFEALVSFTFNLGSGALQRSTLRQKINRLDHDEVPVELMKWVWAGGRKITGLLQRRQAEAIRYRA